MDAVQKDIQDRKKDLGKLKKSQKRMIKKDGAGKPDRMTSKTDHFKNRMDHFETSFDKHFARMDKRFDQVMAALDCLARKLDDWQKEKMACIMALIRMMEEN